MHQCLHRLNKNKINLGGICTGTYLLAKAGLLDGYRCTIHWENMASLRETCPETIVTEELFEIDRNRYTASGGSAPLDMMLQLVKKQHGNKLAVAISEQFMCDRMRGEYDKQRVPLRLLIGSDQPKLTEAVELMEANLEELVNLDDLASLWVYRAVSSNACSKNILVASRAVIIWICDLKSTAITVADCRLNLRDCDRLWLCLCITFQQILPGNVWAFAPRRTTAATDAIVGILNGFRPFWGESQVVIRLINVVTR